MACRVIQPTRTSRRGRELIKRFEGFRSEAYKPHKRDVWTIGYGHTQGVKKGDVVTKQEASKLLSQDLRESEAAVNRLVKVSLSQAQFDALVSLIFNIGAGAFARSTLRRKLNAGEYDEVDDQLARWIYSGGKVFSGLVRRRAAEADLFTDHAPRFVARGCMPQTVKAA